MPKYAKVCQNMPKHAKTKYDKICKPLLFLIPVAYQHLILVLAVIEVKQVASRLAVEIFGVRWVRWVRWQRIRNESSVNKAQGYTLEDLYSL